MARASTETLLALDRYAAVMGINPAHFNGAAGGTIMPAGGSCNSIWWQYAWQAGDRVGREDLAREIRRAEEDLSNYLGYPVAPRWIAQEIHRYPRFYRPNAIRYGGRNVQGLRVGLQANWGKIIAPGQRATTVIGEATTGAGTLVFSDDDGDGYAETATITLPLPAGLTDVSTTEVKVFFDGYTESEWEIRPARSITVAGGNVTIVFWAWQLIDPDIWEALPDYTLGQETAINLDVAGNYVDTVDVYRVYNDTTAQSAELRWEPEPENEVAVCGCTYCDGTGCPECGYTAQDGCMLVRDANLGTVTAWAAEYDTSDARWEGVDLAVCREPEVVRLWYYAGDYSDEWLRGKTDDPMPRKWAQAIAWMATARLERPFCGCDNLRNLQMELRADTAMSSRNGPRYLIPWDILANPFGTRKGEIRAWNLVKNLTRDRIQGAHAI